MKVAKQFISVIVHYWNKLLYVHACVYKMKSFVKKNPGLLTKIALVDLKHCKGSCIPNIILKCNIGAQDFN